MIHYIISKEDQKRILEILQAQDKSIKKIEVKNNTKDFFDSYNFPSISPHCVSINIGWDAIATFTLLNLYGCCGAALLSGLNVDYEYGGLGIGRILYDSIARFLKECGYGLLVCTDVKILPDDRYAEDEDFAHQKLLKNINAKEVHLFTNPRTSNLVGLYSINLNTYKPCKTKPTKKK